MTIADYLLTTLAVFCALAAFAGGFCAGIAYHAKVEQMGEPDEPPPRPKPTWIQPQPKHRLPDDRRI